MVLENRDIVNSSDVWLVGKHVTSASSNDHHAEEGKHLLRIAAIVVIDNHTLLGSQLVMWFC